MPSWAAGLRPPPLSHLPLFAPTHPQYHQASLSPSCVLFFGQAAESEPPEGVTASGAGDAGDFGTGGTDLVDGASLLEPSSTQAALIAQAFPESAAASAC